jgi:hypothetical protein
LTTKNHCNKNGVKRPSSWSDTAFSHFPKRKSAKGVPKRWKSTFTKSTFQNPRIFGIIKEVLLSCFGMKRGPGWGVVACTVKTQCQNLNSISVQTTGVAHLASNFMIHLVMLLKHDLHQKRNIFRTFAPSTPSGNMVFKEKGGVRVG